MKPSLVIFDLGGVVFDADFQRVWNAWAEFASVSGEELAERFAFDSHFEQFERGELPAGEYHLHINELLDVNLSFDDFVSGWNAIYGEPFPEVVECLEPLSQQTKLVALTNTNKVHFEVWPGKYQAALGAFEQIYSSSELGLRKPEIECFYYVLEQCQTPANKALFVDDRSENIQAAKGLGLATIFLEDPKKLMTQLSSVGLLNRP